MHDFFVAVVPEWEQDFVSEFLRFRVSMPQELRKHLLGPVISDKGNRSFIFLPCAGLKVEGWRLKFIEESKKNPHVRYAHLRFGDGTTRIASSDDVTSNEQTEKFFQDQMKKLQEKWNSREEYLREEIKELINRKADIETVLNLVKSERDEAVAFRNKDNVLFAAVNELKSLRGKKKVLDAAQKVAEEFKDKTEVPDSIKILLETLK